MKQGWEYKKLKDVCEKITDGTHQTPKYFYNGYIFLSSRNVTTGKIDWNNVKYIDEKQHFEMQKRVSPQKGDILLAKNGTTGVAAIVDKEVEFDIYVSLAWLRSKGDLIPEFLLHFINSPIAKSQFNKRLKGIGVPNLHLEEIREVKISYPKSLPEQKRIVSILDKAFAAIDKAKANTEQNLKNAKELFEYHSRILYNRLISEKKNEVLGNLANLVRGPFGGSLRKSMFVEKGYAVYEQRNAIDDFTDNFRYFIDEKKFNEMERFSVREGDIIMSCSGTIGKFTIIEKEYIKGIINQALLKITPDANKIIDQYLLFILSNFIQDGSKYSKGAAIKNIIAVKELKKILIPMLSKEKQQTIVQQLDALRAETQKLEAIYKKKLEDLEELKKSILQQAFEGKL